MFSQVIRWPHILPWGTSFLYVTSPTILMITWLHFVQEGRATLSKYSSMTQSVSIQVDERFSLHECLCVECLCVIVNAGLIFRL